MILVKSIVPNQLDQWFSTMSVLGTPFGLAKVVEDSTVNFNIDPRHNVEQFAPHEPKSPTHIQCPLLNLTFMPMHWYCQTI